MNDERRTLCLKCFALWIGLAALYACLRSFTYFSALVHDDGLFLYTGQAWAAGELPYRDFSDHKPPGLFFLLSLPCRLFPFSLFAVKTFLILWAAAGATLLYILCRRITGRLASSIALLLYVFYTSQYTTIRTGGLTEEGALPFVILSFLFFLQTRDWRWTLASGVALGAAVQFRQTFALTALFHFVWIAQQTLTKKQDIKTSATQTLALCAGMLLPECFVSFYFWINGAWWAYFENSYLFNFVYVSASPQNTWQQIFAHHWNFLLSTGPFLLAPIFAILLTPWANQSLRRFLIPLLACFAGDLLAVSLSGEYYTHYYVQAAVSIHLLFVYCISSLAQRIPDNASQRKKAAYWPIAIIVCLSTLLLLTSGVQTYIQNYRSILNDYQNPNRAYAFQRGVASAVNQITGPDDTILLIGQAPNSVYFLSKRYAGSRYFHYSPLWKEKFNDEKNVRFFQQLIFDIQQRKPAVIIMDLTVMNSDAPDVWLQSFSPETAVALRGLYTPLEDAFADDIPEDEWFWYDINVVFWIRNEKLDIVGNKLKASSAL
ncbi:MAG: glycosyltransferase family 39 protein [Candidatus Hinthialibacter antarcticus]|nr:glycosyltransferase family 39 protein [Candidatus Hinthialibacter antarcticus]